MKTQPELTQQIREQLEQLRGFASALEITLGSDVPAFEYAEMLIELVAGLASSAAQLDASRESTWRRVRPANKAQVLPSAGYK